MVLFVIFCPIIAAVLIMLGAPARKTALVASVLMFAAAIFLFASSEHRQGDFQHVTSLSISPEWRLSFTTGVDGLSAVMVLLASIVTLAAVWFAGAIDRYQNAFYACLLFISSGCNRRVRFDRFVFLLRVSRTRVDSHLLVNRNLGQRKPGRSGMENYGLSGGRQFYPAAWTDLALSELSSGFPEFRYSYVADCGLDGPNHSRRATPCVPAAAYRFRNSNLAVSISHMGTGSLRGRTGPRCNAARGCIEEIRLVRAFTSGHSHAA